MSLFNRRSRNLGTLIINSPVFASKLWLLSPRERISCLLKLSCVVRRVLCVLRQAGDIIRDVCSSNIASDDADRMLVCCICCLPGHWIERVGLHVIRDTCHFQILGGIWVLLLLLIIFLLWHMHTFLDGQCLHLLLNSYFILHLLLLPLLHLQVFDSILFIYLSLKGLPHGLLLCFFFILDYCLFISALSENISSSLKFQVNSVLEHTASKLHVRKILFGDAGIKVFRLPLSISSVASLQIECLIVLSQFLLRLGELSSSHLPPFFLFAMEVSLFNLPLQFFCKLFLF